MIELSPLLNYHNDKVLYAMKHHCAIIAILTDLLKILISDSSHNNYLKENDC